MVPRNARRYCAVADRVAQRVGERQDRVALVHQLRRDGLPPAGVGERAVDQDDGGPITPTGLAGVTGVAGGPGVGARGRGRARWRAGSGSGEQGPHQRQRQEGGRQRAGQETVSHLGLLVSKVVPIVDRPAPRADHVPLVVGPSERGGNGSAIPFTGRRGACAVIVVHLVHQDHRAVTTLSPRWIRPVSLRRHHGPRTISSWTTPRFRRLSRFSHRASGCPPRDAAARGARPRCG